MFATNLLNLYVEQRLRSGNAVKYPIVDWTNPAEDDVATGEWRARYPQRGRD
jgi:hypothetical protein